MEVIDLYLGVNWVLTLLGKWDFKKKKKRKGIYKLEWWIEARS